MTLKGAQILEEALTLSPEERAELAEQLFSTLDLSFQKKNDELWAREAESRIDAYERGEIETVSAKDVFDRINAMKRS
ncbi:MAG: addiction module protein [bacterium]|nr:addiction module protein [bacterium]